MNAQTDNLIEINNAGPINILLVEDNESDVFLIKKAFEKSNIMNNIIVASDGEIAMEILHRHGVYKDALRPDIVLLDINLPKKDGKQVLKEIKADETLRSLPVVVLSSSKAEQDILTAYDLQANSYIVKPLNINKYKEVVSAIEKFWFRAVVLPTDI